MSEFQYIDFPTQEVWHKTGFDSSTGEELDVFLDGARNDLLSLKEQKSDEVEKHLDKIKDMLVLCASFFSEADSKGMLLISGKDREELMAAESIFNSFRNELAHAKDEKLHKLIKAITPELQLPLSPAVIEQVKMNAAARTQFLEHYETYSSSDINQINGSTATNKAALASGWRSKGKIFAIDYRGKQLYPAFQFDNQGKPRKVMAKVIKLFDEENKGWQLALWFTNPNAVLNGKMPVEIIASQPESIVDAVKEEAEPTLC